MTKQILCGSLIGISSLTPISESYASPALPITETERLREMSTDRPDTTESPYTVDSGHFQIELSFFDMTSDRHNKSSETSTGYSITPLLLKIGVFDDVDLQLGLDPYTHIRVTDRTTHRSETLEGFGDTVVRVKINLWGNDEGDTAFALMPFVKIPTADDELGNDHVEGGLIAPYAVALPYEFNLGLMAELDLLRSAADDGYVVDFVHTTTIGRDLVGDLAGYIEYAGFANLNGDEDYRGYFDCGLTYGLDSNTQLDGGVRIGLSEAAEDFGGFTGLSVRF